MFHVLTFYGRQQPLGVIQGGVLRWAGVLVKVASQHAGVAFLRWFRRAGTWDVLAGLLAAQFALFPAQLFLAFLLGLDFLRRGFGREERGIAGNEFARHEVAVILCPPVRHFRRFCRRGFLGGSVVACQQSHGGQGQGAHLLAAAQAAVHAAGIGGNAAGGSTHYALEPGDHGAFAELQASAFDTGVDAVGVNVGVELVPPGEAGHFQLHIHD